MANGWTPERRAKQAAMIQRWKPWTQSTGPKSCEGKATSKNNAYVHGLYANAAKNWRKQCLNLVTEARQTGLQRVVHKSYDGPRELVVAVNLR